ncbi:MAG: hypothetical protein Q9227_000056 [Pyrenula ochraceoflavens]
MMHSSLPATPEESHDYRGLPSSSKVDAHDFAIHKHRKATSTGGGRAWSEEEESYLLRTRMHKMPYKHIAAHLHKTELACRLHYHQMSYGSNRRKRTGSMSSTCSAPSYTPIPDMREASPDHHPYVLSPVASPPSSPDSSYKLAPFAASPPLQQKAHVPILPKPVTSESRQLLPSVALNKGLRLDTSFATPADSPAYKLKQIDGSRLRTLYSAHRNSFWNTIAAQYSAESPFTASELEDAFFATFKANPIVRGSSPPTPGASPQALHHPAFSAPALTAVEPRGFHELNNTTPAVTAVSAPSPQSGRCAVSALLNESK